MLTEKEKEFESRNVALEKDIREKMKNLYH